MKTSIYKIFAIGALVAFASSAAGSTGGLEDAALHEIQARALRRHAKRRSYSTSQAFAQFKTSQHAMTVAQNLASHSWEYGTVAEALLEVYNPELSVFSTAAFPNGKVPVVSSPSSVSSLSYASPHIDTGSDTLADGQGSAGDPASLGVSALLLGNAPSSATLYAKSKRWQRRNADNIRRSVRVSSSDFKSAALRQLNTLLQDTPRYSNGAISQRTAVAELWADAMFMIPPFLAYAAVATQNTSLLTEAVLQCGLYRDVLQYEADSTYKRSLDDVNQSQGLFERGSAPSGLWQHIVGPQSQTRGLWATGNGWATLGMVRVLATMRHWSLTSDWSEEEGELKGWLYEIFGALSTIAPSSGNHMWRNYLYGNANDPTDTSHVWFGDGAGTAALVAAALRLAVLDPGSASWLLKITQTARHALATQMSKETSTSKLVPTVNPYDWETTTPIWTGSPEGQAFLGMAIAAWRDCVQAGVCSTSSF